ncbi:MAG: DEAD/DEAH box helicase [Candidatus Hydrogenedentes bacterium]|nr:DEAD/DEAH box helicase [Candidatus Hydrogenedentota bacterium]
MTLAQVLDAIRRDSRLAQNITTWRTTAPRPPEYGGFPPDMDSRLVNGLAELGIHDLYTHQRTAIDAVARGEHVVVVTPTASGKTLCYNLPVLDRLCKDPETRALYLFPTKALSQDQMNELSEFIDKVELKVGTYTFDGDTPASARKAIRKAGHIIVTNPDMLHTGILPHHTIWMKLFERLQYVVIDEIHNYRGVFGSHLANVIRRLKRICAFYGSHPQFIMCSATIANPAELAEWLIEEPVTLVDENGSPTGERHLIFCNPPVVNRELGIRRSVVKQAERFARIFLSGDVQTIIFARSRLRVEILLTYLKEIVKRMRKSTDIVRGYRGGYLPLERREIERGLREGRIKAVVSTNALELGIDIGSLDACIMAGYPGNIASTWQQAGRAGRRNDVSAAVLVASSAPLDQYIISHPDYFFGQSPEHCTVDPNNLIILTSHIKCAAFELPFKDGEPFGLDAQSTEEILNYLEEHRILRHVGGKWYWSAETYPAEDVSLRTASPENVVIIDMTDRTTVIGEVDWESAPVTVYEGAIYLHESRQYTIDTLDLDDKKAYAREIDVDYYTDAQIKAEVHVLDVYRQESAGRATKLTGELRVTWLPTMYKKIKFGSHENVGAGDIHLPEREMHTTGYWIDFPEETLNEFITDGLDLAEGLRALANVLVQVAPIRVMCDPMDIRSHPMVRSPFSEKPTVYMYDSYPGGVGFSLKLFACHDDLLKSARDLIGRCECAEGCPSCVGPALEVGHTGKDGAVRLIDAARTCI